MTLIDWFNVIRDPPVGGVFSALKRASVDYVLWLRSRDWLALRKHRLKMLKPWRQFVQKHKELSPGMWAKAKPHVRTVSQHLNISLIRAICIEDLPPELDVLRGYPDRRLWERIYHGSSLETLPLTNVHFPLESSDPETPQNSDVDPTTQTGTGEETNNTQDAEDRRKKSARQTHGKARRAETSRMPNLAAFKAQEEKLRLATEENVAKLAEKKVYGDEVPEEEVRSLVERGLAFVHFTFTIAQELKLRTVTWFKSTNLTCVPKERLRLPTHAMVVTLIVLWVTGVVLPEENGAVVWQSLEDARTQATSANWHGIKDEQQFDCAVLHFAGRAPYADIPEKRNSARRKVAIWKKDFRSAYYNLSCADYLSNLHAFFNGLQWVFRACMVMAFGSVASVWAWCSAVQMIRWVLLVLFQCVVLCYIDDMFGVFPDEGDEAGLEDTREPALVTEVVEGFGFPLSPEKSDEGTKLQLLGVDYAVSDEKLDGEVRKSKRDKIREAIDHAARICRTAIQAPRKLLEHVAGSVNFMVSACKLSGLRAALSPIYRGLGPSGDNPRTLIQPLNLLRRLVTTGFKLSLNFSAIAAAMTGAPAVLWTDAADSPPMIGAFLKIGDKVWHFSTKVPDSARAALDRMEKKKLINPLELVAVIVAVRVFRSRLAGLRVLCFIDNSSALFAACKGCCKCALMRGLAQELHVLVNELAALLAYRYVPSAFNPSDACTRDDLKPDLDKLVLATGSVAVEVTEGEFAFVIDLIEKLLSGSAPPAQAKTRRKKATPAQVRARRKKKNKATPGHRDAPAASASVKKS